MKIHLAKTFAAITVVLLAVSIMVMTLPAVAQQSLPESITHGGSTLGPGDGIPGPLASGLPVEQILPCEAMLSFRPNPIGVGQPLLVNIWVTPSVNNQQYYNNFTVYIQKPDGTVDVVGPLNSYQGDATSWFEYIPDQAGEWQLKFVFSGEYFPKGLYFQGKIVSESNYTGSSGSSGTQGITAIGAVYYQPDSTEWQSLTVLSEIVPSWPAAPLPTDYWTRPVNTDNREWWPILGAFPGDGYRGGGPVWDELYPGTNPYFADNYNFHPWVDAPDTPHIVWKRQDNLGGLIGGPAGIYGSLGNPGGPSVIYAGRAYGTWNVARYNGITTSCAVCYDVRTGEIFYAIPTSEGGRTPTQVIYNTPTESTTIVGAVASSSWSVELVTLSGSNLYKINPFTGAVSSYSISPLTSSDTFLYNQYDGWYLGVQDLGNETEFSQRYRLINWTSRGSSNNLAGRVLTNTSYSPDGFDTFFRTGVVNETSRYNGNRQIDWSTGVWCQVDSFEQLNTTGTYGGMIVTAYNILSGQKLWMRNLTGTPPYSRSDFITDHGKIALLTTKGVWEAYNLLDGSHAWTSERMGYPWGQNSFGAYAVASSYGMLYRFSYDGVYAINWDDGSIAWRYVAQSLNPWETPYTQDGINMYSFNSGGWVADGKMYIANSEHTTSWPITRGWQLHCINITTGEGIWKIVGDATPYAAADGYLVTGSSQTGYNYVFGKGQSGTTVTASPKTLENGAEVLLEGTVMDMSPAQAGSPCVSRDTMTTQMQYLHFQYPIDGLYHNETLTGVPVLLTAIGSDGSVTDIGTVTTEGYYGTFSMAWTPPAEGKYQIVAAFAGDDSYGSSSASTAISVGPAQSTPSDGEGPATPVDNTMLLYGILVAVIIAIVLAVIAIVALFRKR